jgi:hypothetical protein
MAAGERVKLRARDCGSEGTAVRDRDDLVTASVKNQKGTPIMAKRGQIIEWIANQEARGEVSAGEGANTRES